MNKLHLTDDLGWLLQNADYIKIHRLEKELEIPSSSLKKFIDGKRSLPKRWEYKVSQWVKNFRNQV